MDQLDKKLYNDLNSKIEIPNELDTVIKNGLNKKSLLVGINSSEFRYREADFGHFPKGRQLLFRPIR